MEAFRLKPDAGRATSRVRLHLPYSIMFDPSAGGRIFFAFCYGRRNGRIMVIP